MGGWYHPALERWDSIFPVCKHVCVCVCRLSIVWQSNIALVVLWALTHPSCTPCENAGLGLFWIFRAVCGAQRRNHAAKSEARLFILFFHIKKITHTHTHRNIKSFTKSENNKKKKEKKWCQNPGVTAHRLCRGGHSCWLVEQAGCSPRLCRCCSPVATIMHLLTPPPPSWCALLKLESTCAWNNS